MVTVVGNDRSAAKRVTCQNCGAINEYMKNDIRVLHQGRDISGGPDGSEGFNCGGCGKEIVTRSW